MNRIQLNETACAKMSCIRWMFNAGQIANIYIKIIIEQLMFAINHYVGEWKSPRAESEWESRRVPNKYKNDFVSDRRIASLFFLKKINRRPAWCQCAKSTLHINRALSPLCEPVTMDDYKECANINRAAGADKKKNSKRQPWNKR